MLGLLENAYTHPSGLKEELFLKLPDDYKTYISILLTARKKGSAINGLEVCKKHCMFVVLQKCLQISQVYTYIINIGPNHVLILNKITEFEYLGGFPPNFIPFFSHCSHVCT